MRKIFITLLFFAASVAFAAENVTLQDCYNKSEAQWPLRKQSALLKKQSDLKIQNINSEYLPEMSVFGSAQYQSDVTKITIPFPGISIPEMPKDQYKIGLNVNQLIWDGGISSVRNELETLQAEINSANVEVELYKIKEQVNKAFFSILIIKENIKSIELLESDLQERLSSISSAVRNGVMLQSNYDIIKAELLKARQQKDELTSMFAISLDALNELTGLALDSSSIFVIPSADKFITNENMRKEFSVFKLTRESLEESKKLSESKLKPMFSAFMQGAYAKPGLNMFDEEFKPYWLAGVKASWNIWNWGISDRESQVAEIQKQIVDSQEETFSKSLNLAKIQYIREIEKLEKQLSSDKEIVELRRSIALSQKSRLDNGTTTATEYVTEQNSFRRAELALSIRNIEIIKAKINLSTLMGAQ